MVAHVCNPSTEETGVGVEAEVRAQHPELYKNSLKKVKLRKGEMERKRRQGGNERGRERVALSSK